MKTETKLASDVKDFLVKKKKSLPEGNTCFLLSSNKKKIPVCFIFFKGTYIFILFFFSHFKSNIFLVLKIF